MVSCSVKGRFPGSRGWADCGAREVTLTYYAPVEDMRRLPRTTRLGKNSGCDLGWSVSVR